MDGQRRWAAPSSGEVKRLQMSPEGKTLAVVDSRPVRSVVGHRDRLDAGSAASCTLPTSPT